MSHDLFEATTLARPKPKRARWIVVASALAHVGIVAIVLIGPILAAAQQLVAVASNVVYIPPTVTAVPASPPAPPQTRTAAPTLNPDAAPPQAPQQPVTSEVDVPRGGGGGNAPPDWKPSGDGPFNPFATSTDNRRIVLAPPEPPAPRPTKPLPVGGQIRAPQRLVYVAPVYPPIALSAKIGARVILEATIDETGVVRNVRALRPDPLFEQSAIDAVSRWRYEPTRLNGQAVPVVLTVTVVFEIKR